MSTRNENETQRTGKERAATKPEAAAAAAETTTTTTVTSNVSGHLVQKEAGL